MSLKNYFVSQKQAESLKELGFNEECLASYTENAELVFRPAFHHTEIYAPLIAQAIDWLANELNGTVTDVDSGIEKLKTIRRKIYITVNLEFEVYQYNKTYEDGNYLIVQRDEEYPISVVIMYGEMIGNDGLKFKDDHIEYISSSFTIF